jgi:hypothetical protein
MAIIKANSSIDLLREGVIQMLRCSWCMKKINEDKECFGLSVKFVKGVNLKQDEGTIKSIFLTTRNTSVPMIVVAEDSEAKKQGQDGIFVLCSDKCGVKMKKTLNEEINLFEPDGEILNLK